ncbi:MAG: histidine kinase [Pseudomonadota bacterium]|nr:histidine kinase [Pseudomonadota bacterium]
MTGSYYPKSFFKLILLGIFLVMLPIVYAFYDTARHLERLATRSQEAVYGAVQLTASSRRLFELSSSMERGVRQYLILEQPALIEQYDRQHEEFQRTLAGLKQSAGPSGMSDNLDKLRSSEAALHADVLARRMSTESLAELVPHFIALQGLAQSIYADSDQHIRTEVDAMHSNAIDAERAMAWQLVALVPLAILFAVGFTVFITRPFEQINTAIRVMGKGDLLQQVKVSGPSDLVDLGKQLDWLRSRLLELEEGKKRFLQHVSHELKTPLAALREGSELLADEVGGTLSAQQREIAAILRNKSIQLQRMIENLLNFSAGDAARFNRGLLHVQPVNLRQLIASVLEEHRLVAQGKNLQLQLADSEVVIPVDPEKMRIVIDNLISNAIKFSPEGGTVRAQAVAEGPLAILQVDDQGPGIPVEDRDKIFDPFYRTRTPQQGPVKGTGLGLAIMREFVLAHGGSVRVAENRPKGATFRVSLPNPGPEPAIAALMSTGRTPT